MAEKFRTLDPRFWADESVQALSSLDKLLALYVLCGPQTNRIGIYVFSIGAAAEDLGLPAESVRNGLSRICEALGWKFDQGTRLLYLPSWWRYHGYHKRGGQTSQIPLQNLLGMLADVHELPECSLLDEFLDNDSHLELSPREVLAAATKISEIMRHRGKKGGLAKAKKQAASTPAKKPLAGVVPGVPENPSTQEQELELEEKSMSASSGRFAYPDSFEQFWDAFPKARRTKKMTAFVKWKSASKRVSPSFLTERATAYAASPQGQSPYAVMPSTWLSGAMWEDEPESWGIGAKPVSRVASVEAMKNWNPTDGGIEL